MIELYVAFCIAIACWLVYDNYRRGADLTVTALLSICIIAIVPLYNLYVMIETMDDFVIIKGKQDDN